MARNGMVALRGSIKATKDKTGRLISLDLTRTTASAGNSAGKAQTTTHVPIENDADRRAVASLLGDTANGQLGLNLNWTDGLRSTWVQPGADGFRHYQNYEECNKNC